MTTKQPRLTVVVAIDTRGGIGKNNALPWRLPEDLAHFKRTTTGHPIIMGRKTFDSIGRPLPNRRNIVVTRDPAWRRDGVETAASVADAVALAADGGDTETFVIGGAQIFNEILPSVQKLIVTEIDSTFDCDVFFPRIDPQEWKESAREEYHSAQNGFDYSFITYERR